MMMKPFARWERSTVGKLILVLAASVAAITATLVPVAYYFHRTTATGIIANLFIVPLMGYGAVVVGFAALPLVFVFPSLAGFVLSLAGLLVQVSDRFIFVLARLPLLPHWTPTRFDLFLFLLLMTLLTFLPGLRSRWASVVAFLILMVAGHLQWGGATPKGLEMTFFSVGQAEATLVRFPTGENLLVDGGGNLRDGGADTGERLLAPALWAMGVEHLDVVVLTHPHPDHLRGLRFIVENFPVGRFWETGLHDDSEDYAALHDTLRRRGVPVETLSGANAPRTLGGGRIEPLAPLAGQGNAGEVNDDSLVFRLLWGDLAVLFTGDIGFTTEERLLLRAGQLKAAILKVAHHGSRYSSSEAFLDAVQPRTAVISAGYGNTFHLPAVQTLERLAHRGIAVFRTDLDGTVFLRSSGQGYAVTTYNPY
jgi:competence protein ComEC